jgi:hypothetical protein
LHESANLGLDSVSTSNNVATRDCGLESCRFHCCVIMQQHGLTSMIHQSSRCMLLIRSDMQSLIMSKHSRNCGSRESTLGHIDGNDVFDQWSISGLSFVNRKQMIHGKGTHRSRKGAFGRPRGSDKQANAIIMFEPRWVSVLTRSRAWAVAATLGRPNNWMMRTLAKNTRCDIDGTEDAR